MICCIFDLQWTKSELRRLFTKCLLETTNLVIAVSIINTSSRSISFTRTQFLFFLMFTLYSNYLNSFTLAACFVGDSRLRCTVHRSCWKSNQVWWYPNEVIDPGQLTGWQCYDIVLANPRFVQLHWSNGNSIKEDIKTYLNGRNREIQITWCDYLLICLLRAISSRPIAALVVGRFVHQSTDRFAVKLFENLHVALTTKWTKQQEWSQAHYDNAHRMFSLNAKSLSYYTSDPEIAVLRAIFSIFLDQTGQWIYWKLWMQQF